jgi:hypothetical protein
MIGGPVHPNHITRGRVQYQRIRASAYARAYVRAHVRTCVRGERVRMRGGALRERVRVQKVRCVLQK